MVIGNVSSMTSHAATGIDVEAGIDSQTASVPATPSSENALSSLGRAPSRAAIRANTDVSAEPSHADAPGLLQQVGAYGGPLVDAAASGLSVAAATVCVAAAASRAHQYCQWCPVGWWRGHQPGRQRARQCIGFKRQSGRRCRWRTQCADSFAERKRQHPCGVCIGGGLGIERWGQPGACCQRYRHRSSKPGAAGRQRCSKHRRCRACRCRHYGRSAGRAAHGGETLAPPHPWSGASARLPRSDRPGWRVRMKPLCSRRIV